MANSKHDPNKKHYFLEVGDSEIKDLLIKAAADETKVSIWEKGMSEEVVEEYKLGTFDDKSKKAKLETTGGLFSKLSTSNLIDKNVFIKFGEGKFQIFSTSILQYNSDDKEYSIVIDQAVYKTQQRSNYRLQSSPHIRIQVRIDEDTLHHGLDISAGGTSFMIKEEDQERYQKDVIFNDCKLALNKEVFVIPTVKVAGQWPQKDKKGAVVQVKVGVSFSDINDVTEEALFKAINAEARADEMRKRLAEK